MSESQRSESDLLREVGRLYAALIRVVRDIDDPTLKAEIVGLIWPPKALTTTTTPEVSMTEVVVVPTRSPTIATVLRDTLERAAATFAVALLAIIATEALSNFDIDWGKRLGTAAVVSVAAAVKTAALPKSGLGLSPIVDMMARTAWSAAQTGAAVIVLAGFPMFAWYRVSAWQTVGAAAAAGALSFLKGALASKLVDDTVTPASLAPAA